MTYDVIVAGAGPVGAAAAAECARLGLSVLCIEEHGTIGNPVQCAGLLSTAAFDECRVSRRSIQNTVTGARVISSQGSELRFDARVPRAYVVDRGMLDREMAEAAADAGAEFRLRTALCGIRDDRILTRGVGGAEEFRFRVLIAADGPRSTAARLLGMPRARTYLAGIQAELPAACDPRFVEIYPDAAPDFFGWSIPIAPGRMRVGLCSGSDVPGRFNTLLKRFGTTRIHLVTGTLPLGIMPKTYGSRVLFTGDAAGFAKPTSGGGIYTGVRSARHAALTAAEACTRDTITDEALAPYEQKWKADFGNELEIGFRLFALRQKIDAATMDELIRAMSDPGIVKIIEEYGDMDRPGTLVKMLLVKPALLRLLAPLVRSGLRSFF